MLLESPIRPLRADGGSEGGSLVLTAADGLVLLWEPELRNGR